MGGYVCTIAGGKGGVGKTTTAINVAATLEERGYDTAVVDADLGMANLGAMLGIESEHSVHDVLAGSASTRETVTDIDGGLTVAPGAQRLEAFAEADAAELRTVIETLRDDHDAVLVDTGAGLSHETTVPLGLADGILLVTTPGDVAVADTVKTARLAERVDGEIIGGVACRVTHEIDTGSFAEQLAFPALGVVPADSDATGDEPLVHAAPDSAAADAYRRLTAVLEAVFFEGTPPSDTDVAFDEEWFTEEKESSGGRFGFFG